MAHTSTFAHGMIAVVVFLSATPAAATPGGAAEDFARAGELSSRFSGKVFGQPMGMQWAKDGRSLWYQRQLADGLRQYIRVDAENGKRQEAFDHLKMAALLRDKGLEVPSPFRLPIQRLQLLEHGQVATFRAGSKRWRVDLRKYEITEIEQGEAAGAGEGLANIRPRRSGPNGEETSIHFVNRLEVSVELFWVDPNGQRVSYGKLEAGGQRDQHTFANHVWAVVDAQGNTIAAFAADANEKLAVIDGRPVDPEPARQVRRSSVPRSGARPRVRMGRSSPDGRYEIEIRENNVFLIDSENNEQTQLTEDGEVGFAYTLAVYWAPNSRHVVVMKRKNVEERTIHIVESAPRDQLQPKLHEIRYAKPGDPIDQSFPHLFDAGAKAKVPVNRQLFANPWRISHLQWEDDSSQFTFLYNQRGHRVMRLVGFDPNTGKATSIVDEQPDTFFDYNSKLHLTRVADTGELIWMSERDGWNHLYRIDVATGKVLNQITSGEWVVRDVERVDTDNRQIWFTAGGIYADQDPYHLHYGRVNFDGSGLTWLTESDGTHQWEYSPDGEYLIDTYSRVDLAPVTELRRVSDGQLITQLEQANPTRLESAGWIAPERFVAKGRDGRTDIWGVIFKPTNFDSKQKYPVIEHIYAGPHGAFVPKKFATVHPLQRMAELGFIVVQIDGMGTNYRSKAFHDVAWKNIADAGLKDRILWMREAADTRPWMDIERVGIYGGSAGGQNAMAAMLWHGNFYKAAVAGCGCHDNRMDKIWWNELWMSWPIGPHYDEQSNVANAYRLQGDLMLIVGEMDRNVDPASTMQVVDALVKADKDFDLVVVPGAGHGMGGPYGDRRMKDFFIRKLLGVEPRR